MSLVRFIVEKEPSLWGLVKTRNWISKSVYLTLYKHLKGIGYSSLLLQIKRWYDVGSATLVHNMRMILKLSLGWSQQWIVSGTQSDWRRAARNTSFPKSQKGVTLWMDSCDIKLIGKNSISTTDRSWSYKEIASVQQFMFAQDARTRFRAVFGGYSLKIDDGSALSLQHHVLNMMFKYAVISTDSGFVAGKRLFEKIKFVTPFSK